MKTRLNRKAKQLASSLLAALVICSILSLFVMYYLSLIEQQNILSARSQTWNMAIAVSEAGVEEGLQQLNSAWPSLGSDGWAYDGSTCYFKSNSLPEGNGYMAYIFITNATSPIVVARAFVTPPNASFWESGWHTAGMILFASQGQSGNSGESQVTRAVQVTTAKTSPFDAAMIAKKNIDLNGNNISTDSFNSVVPGENTNGQYDSSPTGYHGDHGDIATDLGVIDSISGGNANVFGHAHTGPGSPNNAVQIGPNGFIGSHQDYANGVKGIDPGWWLDDANYTFPDTSYPNTSSYLTPTNGWVTNIVTTGTPNYVTNIGVVPPSPLSSIVATNTTYMTGLTVQPISGFTTSGSYKDKGNTYYWENAIVSYTSIASWTSNSVPVGTYYDHILWGDSSVTNSYIATDLSGQTLVTGPNVVLALPNGLNMSGQDGVTFATGATMIVYNGGTSCTIGGNGFINPTGFASNLILYCAPTVTTLTYSGNAGFKGIVVAPSVDVSLNGSGNSNAIDFTGCLLANSITLNGHFNFHYDEALSGAQGYGRFIILTWNEIK